MATNDASMDAVRQYYASFGEREWQRLANPDDGAIEFAITCRALAKHLPASGRILDIGGGPGRYAIWLAERGYRVVLADLSPNLLDIAKEKIAQAGVEDNVESITVADVRDLSGWANDAFDAILALGPFYHLPDPEDRERAAAEVVRVLRPNGPLFAAFMPLYTMIRRTIAVVDERKHFLQPDWLDQLVNHGRFDNDVPGRFDSGFAARPDEIAPFFDRFGLESQELLGTESLSVGMQGSIAEIALEDPETYERVLDLLEDTASDPSIHGLSGHLLYVGRKNEVPVVGQKSE